MPIKDGFRSPSGNLPVANVSPSLFSINSKVACENCQGLGVIYTDLKARLHCVVMALNGEG
jgi:excinuclease UvrABC ATPase subunit